MELSIQEILEATDGVLYAPHEAKACDFVASSACDICGISWDSRDVHPHNLYLALPGERVDGHEFVEAAAKAGAACALVSRLQDASIPQILVEDTQVALMKLAQYWRKLIGARVVALTGSSGKTSTKALVRDVLGAHGQVCATKANQNNELGVPRTILNAHKTTQFLVLEMGMRGLGQIEQLCSFAQPHWGIITNVGESHMELLGSRENIARAKAELYRALPDDGIAFVNTACDYVEGLLEFSDIEERSIRTVLFDVLGDPLVRFEQPLSDASFGAHSCKQLAGLLQASPRVWASRVRLDDQGCAHFVLHAQAFEKIGMAHANGEIACDLKLCGIHNVSNALSAAAVGLVAGMSLEDCSLALAKSKPESGRQQYLRTKSGALVVNDAYNANPDSMKASLASFAALKMHGKRMAVLGDMGELGAIEKEAHERVGALAAQAELDTLVCVGELAHFIAQGALNAGMPSSKIIEFLKTEDALCYIQKHLDGADAVLLKASHFMAFEALVEGLVE